MSRLELLFFLRRRRTVLPRGDRHLAFGSCLKQGSWTPKMLPDGAQLYRQVIPRPFRVSSLDLSCSERAVEVKYESWGVPVGRGSRARLR
jgi:hypothetical protein